MIEDSEQIAEILSRTRVVACVGFSANPERPSHYVSQFLAERGLRVIPVNPGLAGQEFLGETVVARLSDIPHEAEVDFVDIFRRPEEIPAITTEALTHLPHLKTIWMQLGIRHQEAAEQAEALGIDVVQDRCPKIEIPRLGV